jgi:hypothetical protein
MKRCESGHYFDPLKNRTCPYCGIKSGAQDETKRIPAVNEETPDQATQRYGAGRKVPAGTSETIRVPVKKLGMDPIVGWLVCIEGDGRGRDYRVKTERNFIGRSPSMDICIEGDDAISREKHAILSFNPKNLRFSFAPGDGRGLIYHNGDEVNQPVELQPYDLLEMGASKFMFIPFCGEKFRWQEEQ